MSNNQLKCPQKGGTELRVEEGRVGSEETELKLRHRADTDSIS